MASIATLSRLSAVLTLDITRFMTNSERVSARLAKLRKEAVAFGQGFSRSFTLGFALVSAGAIKVAADFDQLQAQLEAVTGGSGMDELTAQAKRLGRETVFTATDIANLQLELSKLGFASQEVQSAVGSAADITAVFGGDLVKTGTTIAEVVRQFSNANLDSARVADVMAVAFQNTALSTDNFAQAMKNVGSVANITGNDFESTVALLGLLANAGQKGGIAGTRLKGVFIRLGKQLGVTGDEIKLLTSGQLDFNQLIEIFRNRAGVAAAVISELGDEFELLKQQLIDSNGASAALASGLNERLFFSLKRIQAATESIGITLGEAFGPTLKGFADLVSDFAASLENADASSLRFAVGLGAVLAILPPLTFLLTQLVTGIAAVFQGGFATAAAGLLALAAAITNARIQSALTVGVLEDSVTVVKDFSDSLNKAAEDGAENFRKRIAVLNEELDKVAGDDRLNAEEKIEATKRLESSIADLTARMQGFNNFSADNADAEIEDFSDEIKKSRTALNKYNYQLNQSKKRVQELTDEVNNLYVGQNALREELLKEIRAELTLKATLEVDVAAEQSRLNGLLADQQLEAQTQLSFDQTFDQFNRTVREGSVELVRLQSKLQDVKSDIADRAGELDQLGLGRVQSIVDEQLREIRGTKFDLEADIKLADQSLSDAVAELSAAFNRVDLSIFSPQQLQAEVTKFENMLKDLDDARARFTDQQDNAFGNFVSNTGLSFEILGRKLAQIFTGETDVQLDAEFLERFQTAENATERIVELDTRRAGILKIVEKLQEEINRQLDEQRKKAEEAQALSDIYTNIFPSDADAKVAIEAFDKLKEALIKAQAEFGQTTDNFENAGSAISALKDETLTLLEVLQFGDFGFDLLENFRGFTSFEVKERVKGINDTADALNQFIQTQLALGNLDVALTFGPMADDAERLAEKLQLIADIDALDKTQKDAEKLANALFGEDLLERADLLKEIISSLDAEIRGQQSKQGFVNPEDAERLRQLREELRLLQDQIKSETFQIELGTGLSDVNVLTGRLEKMNDLISRQSKEAIAELNREFNALSDKGSVVDDAFELGSDKLVTLESVDAAIEANINSLDLLTATTEDFQKVAARDEELEAFKTKLLETKTAAAEAVSQMLALKQEMQAITDNAAFAEQLLDLEAIDDQLYYGLITPLEAAQQQMGILRDLTVQAFNNPEVLKGMGLTIDDLIRQTQEAEAFVFTMERAAAIQQFMAQQVQFIGQAFVAARTEGVKFTDALEDGFKKAIAGITGQLLSLLAAFALLSVFIPGFGAAVGGLGQFLTNGLGIPGGGTALSNLGRLAGGGPDGRSLNVGGSISGNTIVLANERGRRATQRTFG